MPVNLVTSNKQVSKLGIITTAQGYPDLYEIYSVYLHIFVFDQISKKIQTH